MVNRVDGRVNRIPFPPLIMLKTLLFLFVLSDVFTLSIFCDAKKQERDNSFSSLRFGGRGFQGRGLEGERGRGRTYQRVLQREGKNLRRRETALKKDGVPSLRSNDNIISEDSSSSHFFDRNLMETGVVTGSTESDALVISSIEGKRVTTEALCDGTVEYVTCSTKNRVVELNFLDLDYPLGEKFLPENVTLLDQLEVLVLQGSGISSEIPPWIGNLTKLKTLDLSFNSLYGSCPVSVEKLTHLTTLFLNQNAGLIGTPSFFLGVLRLVNLKEVDLSSVDLLGSPLPPMVKNWKNLTSLTMDYSNLTGPLPLELIDCTELQILDLSSNELSGPFPLEYGSLTKLTMLDLQGTNFSGTLPNSISKLVNLNFLNLANNSFTGSVPESWKSLKKLVSLLLVNNKLSGGFPLVATQMESLAVMDLSYNQFSGVIPASINELQETLTGLGLSNNGFEGPFPFTSISQFSSLEFLDLSYNKLNGTIGVNCTLLASLCILNLAFNNLTGNIPETFVGCCKDEGFSLALDFSGNQLSGQLSPNVFKNQPFSEIRLAGNDFSGPIPIVNSTGSLLTYVNLQNNRFTGSIPPFGSHKSLVEFNVSGNLLSGKVPSNFLPKDSISSVDLSHNLLEGEIPSNFGKYTNISLIRLRDNNFSGSIPEFLLNNTVISFLDLRSNQLTGPISGINNSFMNMSNVYLGGNFLNGSIPENIAKSSTLLELSLENNKFTGPLPSNFSSNLRLSSFNASNNNLSGNIPSSLGRVQTLMELDLDSNSLTGPFPPELGNLTNLLYLGLRKNLLSGVLPAELGNLTKLSVLDLSSNAFTGNLPPQLAGLASLTFFNVSNNNFSGSLPGGNLTKFDGSSYLNNTASLCGYPLTVCPSNVKNGDDGLSTGAVIGISVGAASFGILLLLLGAFFLWHLRKYGPDGGELILYHKLDFPLSYRSILEATDNFGEANLLGVGGFGSVYRATLGDGQMEVAIKRLAAGSGQGLKELRAETKTLGSLRHRNLVTLIGSYTSRKEALLIYEFISGGDLDGYLNGQKKSFSDWQSRHYVLVGSARGFKYLHHDCQPAVIHRDIKPANILLDGEMEPRIADFGLAKELDIDTKSHLSTSVSGTVGYLAPEYVLKKRLTTKSDVYAFGIVILQILTGRRPTDKSIGESGLAAWVSLLWIKRAALDAVDPNLKLEEHEQGQLLGALKIGLMCTSRKPTDRPSMAQVVHLLENLDLFTADSMGEVGEEKVEKVVH